MPIKNSKTDVASPIKELVKRKPVKVATQEADGVKRIQYDESQSSHEEKREE